VQSTRFENNQSNSKLLCWLKATLAFQQAHRSSAILVKIVITFPFFPSACSMAQLLHCIVVVGMPHADACINFDNSFRICISK
jgi:hypothetical protein